MSLKPNSHQIWNQSWEEQFVWYGMPVICSAFRQDYLMSECPDPMNSPDAQELAGKYLESLENRVHWSWEVNKVRLQRIALHVRDTPHEVLVFHNKKLRELWGTRPAVVYKGGVPWYNKLKGISFTVFKDKRLRPLIVFEDTVEDNLLRAEL